MTKTAAYNANEVAAVYMSLNRNDLLSSDEGGSKLSTDTSLKNGFYGLSDPFNLRGLLESFEADFSQGSGNHSYRIRILNPTTELETLLLGFYSEVFPSNTSPFTQFESASRREKNMNSVEAVEGKNDEPPSLPSLYLRFGYGTNADSGLSRIHKAKVFDIKYYVSHDEDKVIELHAVDLFSYSKQNPEFNRRPYLARVQASDEVDGQLSLKKPSEILAEIFALYLGTYPECFPVVDLGSYEDSIDGVVYSVAKALSKSDAISTHNAELKEDGFEPSQNEDVETDALTAEDVKAFEDLLDRPLITTKNINRDVNGTVSPQILYQAFKMVFEAIGLKWEMNQEGAPVPITGVISPNQTTGSNVSPEKGFEDETAAASNIENKLINLQSEWLYPGLESSYTVVKSPLSHLDGQKRLSFWPMAWQDGEIRPLTTTEKKDNPYWRIWLNAGMANPANNRVNNPINDDASFKFSFPFRQLRTAFSTDQAFAAKKAVKTGTGDSFIQPIPVSCPVRVGRASEGTHPQTVTLEGIQTNVNSVIGNFCTPLIDINSGGLFNFNSYSALPSGQFHTWANYAAGVEILNSNSLASEDQKALVPQLAFNPPLVNLEPTAETALWVNRNIQNYDANIAKRQEEFNELITKLKNEAEQTFSGITKFIPNDSQETRFRKFIDRHANAYVSMGADGENPHISSFLQTTLNNLNRLLIGKSSKMRVEQVQVNVLTAQDKKALEENSTLFQGINWEEAWAKKNNCLLLLMPESSIASHYSDHVIRPILSFPQTNGPDVGAKYCWLDYGTPDSIVAKAEFTGNTRVLVNIAQSNYSVRQWNDITQLFDGDGTVSNQLLSNVISTILANEIATLDGTQSTKTQIAQKDELVRLQKLTHNESSMAIEVELLELLPELLSSYQIDSETGFDDLSKIEFVTPNSAEQLRKLASLISNPERLHMLYPDVYSADGKTNEVTSPSLIVSKNGIKRVDKPIRILRRRVDLDTIRSRISLGEQSRKLTDVAYNYSIAMQQESFTVKLTTLGIPEIDDPAFEYLSRRICFKYYDPRLANGQLHWLSGVYQLTGFKHRINPSQGFLTELEMVKLPKESLSNIRVAR